MQALAGNTLRAGVAVTALLLAAVVAAQPAGSLGGFGLPAQRGAGGANVASSASVVDVSAVMSSGDDAVAPGSDLVLAVVLNQRPGWHVHTNDPQVPPELGDASNYIPTRVAVTVPPGSPLVPHKAYTQWPEPVAIEVAFLGEPVAYEVFSGKAVVYVPVKVATDAEPGTYPLNVRVVYQACDDRSCKLPVGVVDPATGKPVGGEERSVTVTVRPLSELAGGGAAGGTGVSSGAEAGDESLFDGFDASVWADINAGVRPVEALRFDLFGWTFTLTPSGAGFVALLVVAAVGGLLLNFTPCVLPVIPIKVMSLSRAAERQADGSGRGRALLLGVAMAAGVVGFWLALGGAIATVSGFDAVNALFQRSWFTLGVGVVILIMALGMTGLFTTALPRWVYRITPNQESPAGSFGLGVMTAVLSTPCTAPFMGTAAAWATTRPPPVTLATFAAIGAGMAAPYLVLAAFPALVAKMPRTGPASELIKQVMGLLMLAAAAYFLGVGLATVTATPPDPPTLAYWWVVAACVVAAGLWLILRTWRMTRSTVKRLAWSGVGAAACVVALGAGRSLASDGPIDWVYYTPGRLAAALADGDAVVVDFTAAWCLNCKALEHSVLFSDRVAALDDEPGVTFMKVDLTSGSNTAGRALLADVGRVTIPALVVFAPSGEATFNGDFYTVEQVVEAVDAARP